MVSRGEPAVSAQVTYVHALDGRRLALSELAPAESAPRGAPAFLLIHGMAQNRLAYTLGGLSSALRARGARVFVGELRGHGLSRDGDDEGWSLEKHLVEDLPALVGAACARGAVDRVHLVGHSMGGILGYALLARSDRIASLTTLGAPVILGTGRPLLRLLAHAAPAVCFVLGDRLIPMDHLLRWVGPLASLPSRKGPRGALRDLIRLASHEDAEPSHLHEIFSNADPVAASVLFGLAAIARTGRAVIAGTDLLSAVASSPVPVAAVVGGRDVFAGRSSVAPILRGIGPRKVMELKRAGHVDLTVGHHSDRIVSELWSFLLGTS